MFDVGFDAGNYTKDEIVELVRRHVDGIEVEYKDLIFDGDMRDIRVFFAKIRRVLDDACWYDSYGQDRASMWGGG